MVLMDKLYQSFFLVGKRVWIWGLKFWELNGEERGGTFSSLPTRHAFNSPKNGQVLLHYVCPIIIIYIITHL